MQLQRCWDAEPNVAAGHSGTGKPKGFDNAARLSGPEHGRLRPQMSLQRIRGMRDLEVANLRTLPERLATAQRNGMITDDQLCELMGWTFTELAEIKTGARRPTPAEMRALHGIFGKGPQGLLRTRYRKGHVPPRKAADWVILGHRAELSELDRLRGENQVLKAQLAGIDGELKRLLREWQGIERLARKLERNLDRS